MPILNVNTSFRELFSKFFLDMESVRSMSVSKADIRQCLRSNWLVSLEDPTILDINSDKYR